MQSAFFRVVCPVHWLEGAQPVKDTVHDFWMFMCAIKTFLNIACLIAESKSVGFEQCRKRPSNGTNQFKCIYFFHYHFAFPEQYGSTYSRSSCDKDNHVITVESFPKTQPVLNSIPKWSFNILQLFCLKIIFTFYNHIRLVHINNSAFTSIHGLQI